MEIQLTKITAPQKDNSGEIIQLTDATMRERREKILKLMIQENIDTLVIYNDLEHGANFAYLTGFVTRFEEGILVLHQTGEAFLILGNENTKMVNYSRIKATLVHTPYFSLPDQPMDNERPLAEVFGDVGIQPDATVGVVGWKMFTGNYGQQRQLFDVPAFIIAALQTALTTGTLENRSDLFIHSAYGARATNNANEIAHYEYGSSLASDNVLTALEQIEVGKTELEIADSLVRYGQVPNVVPIVATGERFEQAYIYPRNKKVSRGDKLSITTGFKGGLASRSGYAVTTREELPKDQQDYLERVAAPYYRAVVTWLEQIRIGMTGGQLYQVVEAVLPKEHYGWTLNPGHLTSDEEWMSSPIKKESAIPLQSGMLLQIDIIPSVAGYAGASCESGIALADETLRQALATQYPDLWARIVTRREYLINELNIQLPDCVLPLSSGVAYYPPYFLDLTVALAKMAGNE